MAELKPCPFCGAAAMVVANKYRHEQTTYCVRCTDNNCPVIPATYEHSSLDGAIEAWNRRAEDGK